ncbi:YqgQ family protein [Halobacillus massiliensis]|uniref:YqgQ family protein n=1 Tax=Halobacillus massiliensis TaxID=1926286 RepID=UPI0009E47983|nr:YqgQ family protein [Halobacillus massiliensis]
MKTIYDVQQLLKKFGTFIYIGDRLAELELMEEEIMELYKSQCLPKEQFELAVMLLRSEIAVLKDKKTGE